jgi:hypothetical protein
MKSKRDVTLASIYLIEKEGNVGGAGELARVAGAASVRPEGY